MEFLQWPNLFCIYCTSLIRMDHGVCPTCRGHLVQKMNCEVAMLGPVKVRSLFSWTKDMNPEVSKLVTQLKGGEHSQLWPHLANHFVQGHWTGVMKFLHSLQSAVLIPVPSKRSPSQDHAYGFAKNLSEILKIPMGSAGRPLKDRAQKHKTRLQRQATRFHGTPSVPSDVTSAIVVDDIVTTGATARAVRELVEAHRQRAGEPPLNWEVWVLANRRSHSTTLRQTSKSVKP